MRRNQLRFLKENTSVFIRCHLEHNAVVCAAHTANGKEAARFILSRSGVKQRVALWFRLAWLFTEKVRGIPLKIRCLRDLSAEEREKISALFPYVCEYGSIKKFYAIYRHVNQSFPYDIHEKLMEKGRRLLAEETCRADGTWKLAKLDGKLFLLCKWDNGDGRHIVIANEEMRYSDLPIRAVFKEELRFENCGGEISGYYSSKYPGSHLDTYIKNGGGRVFYFLCSPQLNHPFELLAKCGLSYIADSLERFRMLNLAASNIKEIFSLPVRCLKAFNSRDGRTFLFESEDRRCIKWIYKTAPQFFSEPFAEILFLWGAYTYRSWFMLLPDGKILADILPESFAYLKKQDELLENPYQTFAFYQNYIIYSIRIGEFISGVHPKNLEKSVAQCVDFLECQRYAQGGQKFKAAVNRERYMFYEDAQNPDYEIKRPLSPVEMYRAGWALHNCLRMYINSIKSCNAIIMLIYQKNDGKIVGAIEIRGNSVMQAKGSCNKPLAQPVKDYLEDYMRRKGLNG